MFGQSEKQFGVDEMTASFTQSSCLTMCFCVDYELNFHVYERYHNKQIRDLLAALNDDKK